MATSPLRRRQGRRSGWFHRHGWFRWLMEETHRGEDEEAPPLRGVVNMILDKRVWGHEPASPLWVLDRYTRHLERSRTAALRRLLSLQKRQPKRDAAGGEADEPGAASGATEMQARVSPLQNEANVPAGGDAPQRQAPQGDAAARAAPTTHQSAPGEASAEGQ